MGWIDPTALASAPAHIVIPFLFVPLWLIFIAGLVVSTLAIVLDWAGAPPYRQGRGNPSMRRQVPRTTGATLLLSGTERQFQRSPGKG